jgi:hypothetical protein
MVDFILKYERNHRKNFKIFVKFRSKYPKNNFWEYGMRQSL